MVSLKHLSDAMSSFQVTREAKCTFSSNAAIVKSIIASNF